MKSDFAKVKKILWIILFANLAIAAVKIAIGTIIKSASMTADGFHSLTDGSSNIVGLVGIHFASKAVDEDHPYGHRKFEILAGVFIAVMLFVISGKIVTDGIGRLRSPVVPEFSTVSFILLLMTLLTNIFVSVLEYRKGKELNSPILVCDSMHTRSDIYISTGVLATLLCTRLGAPPIIDPIASFIVAGFILYAGYKIFKDNSGILVDRAAVDTEIIREIALSFEKVRDTHNIRSRGCGNDLHVDMHIMTEPDMSVQESHELIHNIEDRIKREINMNIQLIAHMEPFSEDPGHDL
jgi:cation diffusion facilitator family transporter